MYVCMYVCMQYALYVCLLFSHVFTHAPATTTTSNNLFWLSGCGMECMYGWSSMAEASD